MIRLLLALAFGAALHEAAAAGQGDDLAAERAELERMKQALETGVAGLNADCAQVDSRDAAKVADCGERNARLRSGMEEYAKRLAAYRCRSAEAAAAGLKEDIEHNQAAIRKIGLGTTTEAYERLEDVTREQLHDFEGELFEATFSAFVELGKIGAKAAASTGTAQGRRYVKYARDLGIDNPHVLEAIDAFSKAQGKPEKARALNEAVTRLRESGLTAYHSFKAGETQSAGERAWQLAAVALVLTEDAYPELARELARRFPSLAVGAAKQLTVSLGVAVAAPAVSFAHNMRALGYTSDAVRALDIASVQQLEAVDRLHARMKMLVAQLRTQRAVLAGCRS